MLKTCSNTDKPPKPNKKAHITILIVRILEGMEHTKETPFVSSKRPVKIALIKAESTPKTLNKGEKARDIILTILLVFNIEIITENRTTNPPINKIVLMEFVMLFPITPPKFDREILS